MGTPVEAILKNGEQEIKDGRCPTCRQRNSLAGEREMDDGSVLVWFCNVRGCSNHQDHTNAPSHLPPASGGKVPPDVQPSESGDGNAD